MKKKIFICLLLFGFILGGCANGKDHLSIVLNDENVMDYLEYYTVYEQEELPVMTFYVRVKEEYLNDLDVDESHISFEMSFERGAQYGEFSEDLSSFIANGKFEVWQGADVKDDYSLDWIEGVGYAVEYSKTEAHLGTQSFGPLYPNNEEIFNVEGELFYNN